MAVALIVAAGRGERLGTDGPKAFVTLAGRPMVAWSIDAFRQWDADAQIVIAVPRGWEPSTDAEREAVEGCIVCEGGAERSHSVRAALAASGEGAADQVVLVHDAARPLVESSLIERMEEALGGSDAPDGAVAAVPATDTIRIAGSDGRVTQTPTRSSVWAMQTPQAFRRETLDRALAQDDQVLARATDDAALVEALGGRIDLVRSTTANLKVTTPVDLQVAAALLAERRQEAP